MILRFGIDANAYVEVDDEMTSQRMTPEHVEDYLRRMREVVVKTYQELAAFDEAMSEHIHDID